jgi:hypothetical protein
MSEMLRRRNLHIQFAPTNNKADGSKDPNEGMYDAQRDQKEESRATATGAGIEGDVNSSLPVYRISYMGLKEELKQKTTLQLFGIVGFLALLNFPQFLFISKFWAVVGSIVCPLIVIVIPGCFYY